MTVSTSSIVYAYADQFLEARRRGGVELPCRDVRVKKRDLAATAMTAAFVALAEAEHARLKTGTRGVLLGLRRRSTVFVDPLGGGASLRGLEGSLLASLSDDHDANAVGTTIERLLPMSGDPGAM